MIAVHYWLTFKQLTPGLRTAMSVLGIESPSIHTLPTLGMHVADPHGQKFRLDAV